MLKEYRADLHIHTCLSPCADLDMTPLAIVETAIEKDLDIIAVTDHNSAENVTSTKKAAKNTGLTVLGGMEVTSSEEVHTIVIFNDTEGILKFQEVIYENLQPGENKERQFGEQVVVNEKNEILHFNKRLLIGATSLSISTIVEIAHSFEGLAIASHIDRDAFGIISQLGFIPGDLRFDALEISPKTDREKAENEYKEYTHFSLVSCSDAHYLKDIGKRSAIFHMKEPTLPEIGLALKNIDGRKFEWG
jgi:PHP family Zn ribbon phosphoesterase